MNEITPDMTHGAQVAGKQMQSVKQILQWQGVLAAPVLPSQMAQAQPLTKDEVARLRTAVEGIPELASTLKQD